MGWVHGHRRPGALVALAALAIQIVLSFGHVHLDGVRAAPAQAAVRQQTAFTAAPRQGPAQSPDDDDYCAICASIFLVSTSLISHAPPLPAPLAFHRVEHFVSIARGIDEPRRFAFQSRAPPAA